MNSFLHTLSALLSGAFLNLGFERLAEWLDPVSCSSDAVSKVELAAAVPCTGGGGPCDLPVEYSLAH